MAKKKTPPPAAAPPAPTQQDFLNKYSTTIAMVDSDPSLKQLFADAVKNNYTPENFQALLRQTSWYLNHGDLWRAAELAKNTDPGSWQQELGLASTAIKQQMTAMGFTLDDQQVADLAEKALHMAGGSSRSIDVNWLKPQVVAMGRLTGAGGTALQTMDKLKQSAYLNGVQYNDSWYEQAAKDVLSGTGTIDAWDKQIKDFAKSKYAALAPQIDAGMNVMDIASPYLQEMANTFEMNPNSLSLNDPTIQKALTGLNDKSEPALKPLWKFQQELKQDNRYFQTNQAHQDMQSLATEIARQFGKAV